MGKDSTQSFCLKILVAKDKNKVIMAESSKEFIEALFSFMTMPIGSVVRLTRNSSPEDIGCVTNLYESIEQLDMNLFQEKKSQKILLNPRGAAEIYCENLELNLTGKGMKFFSVCDVKKCDAISYYNTGKCRCGEDIMHFLIVPPSSKLFPEEEGGFLKSTARFMITDDLKVMPVAMVDLPLLNEFGKYGKTEEMTFKIGRDEVLKLLKCSLRSQTPLSDTFLNKSIDMSNNELLDMNSNLRHIHRSVKVNDFWKKSKSIRLKIVFNKVSNVALYAVVNEDFVNLLSTFLTLPLGYFFNHFTSSSFEGCLGNLHKSILETDTDLFCCNKKEILVNPKLAPGLPYKSNLIAIEEADISCESSHLFRPLSARKRLIRSQSNQVAQKVMEGFIKGPATFLVLDDLAVKPLSPISLKLLVDKFMVPLSDLAEKEVIIDEEKAMRLLAASLLSDHALTTTFLHKENVDCMDFLQLMWERKNIFKAY